MQIIYKELYEHFKNHEFDFKYKQILQDKKRLPTGEFLTLSLNITSLRQNFTQMILAPLRPPYLIEQMHFQESRSPGIQLPGYNLNESQLLFTTGTQLPMHGTTNYTCHIRTGDFQIVSKQVNHDWINENSVSAVFNTLNKTNSDDIGSNITTINLYIPNAINASKIKRKYKGIYI
jgi:hypothetical protein